MHFIGDELRDRMELLGIDIPTLANMTFMDEAAITSILDDEVAMEELDEFDLALLCNALHCDRMYFIDQNVKNRDLLVSTLNRGVDTVKSRNVKARIQDYLNDYAFVREVLSEEV